MSGKKDLSMVNQRLRYFFYITTKFKASNCESTDYRYAAMLKNENQCSFSRFITTDLKKKIKKL